MKTAGWLGSLSFQRSPARDQWEARSRASPRVLLTTPKSFQSPAGFGSRLIAHEGRPPREPWAPANAGASWKVVRMRQQTFKCCSATLSAPPHLNQSDLWGEEQDTRRKGPRPLPGPHLENPAPPPLRLGEVRVPPRAAERRRPCSDVCTRPLPLVAKEPCSRVAGTSVRAWGAWRVAVCLVTFSSLIFTWQRLLRRKQSHPAG